MYEHFRNEFITQLTNFEEEELQSVLLTLDKTAVSYDFIKKEENSEFLEDELPEMVKIYLMCKKMEGLSENTLSSYKKTLELFFKQLKKTPDKIKTNDIRLYLYQYQQEREITNRSLDKYREYICRFFSWARNEGYIDINPAENLKPISHEVKPRESLTQIELEYLREACETPREKAIIEFFYSTGCRVSELANVKISDIDWHDKMVHLVGKGKKHRTSFLNAKAEITLRNYLATRNDECEYLFVSLRRPIRQLHSDGINKIVRNIVKRMPKEINKNITPHTLRHTTATTALQNGMPINDIQKLLGHASVETTMVYAETSLEEVQAGHKKYII